MPTPATPITASEFTDLGLADWRVLRSQIEATFEAPSYADAGRFVAEVAVLCDEQDHHAAIDLRYPGMVHITSTTHYRACLTDCDVALARAISGSAARRGLRSTPLAAMQLEVAIDALDIDRVRAFWEAVLGYRSGSADDVVDGRDIGPPVWFQQMDEPRQQRNRIHLDVNVPHDVAEDRVAAAVAAGGRLVSDADAPAFWVLADAEGNEACICTWQGRD